MNKIITRTPLRISFVGGGTDIPSFYQKHGGAVISTAIDKFVTVEVTPRADSRVTVKSAMPYENASFSTELRNPFVREALQKAKVHGGVDIEIKSDVAAGSGLGSSSALTVGLLNALMAYQSQMTPYKEFLAEASCEIEIETLGRQVGKQDAYASVYGGLRRYTFMRNGEVHIETIKPPRGLEDMLLLFDTHLRRDADKVLEEQSRTADEKTLLEMKALVGTFYALLQTGDIKRLGQVLHRGVDTQAVIGKVYLKQ